MRTFKRVFFVKQTILIEIKKNMNFSTDTLEPIKMSYNVFGSNTPSEKKEPPPVIAMHGLLGSAAIWRTHCKALHQNTVPRRKIIAVDARNHGESPHTKEHSYPLLAEDVKILLGELKIKKAALLGHSMGGRALMYFALNNTDVVEKLIVGDISPVSESGGFEFMAKVLDTLQKIVLPKNMPELAARLNVDEQLVTMLKDPLLCMFLLTNLTKHYDNSYKWKANVPVLAQNFSSNMLKFPSIKNLKFTGPTLFVLGGASDFVPDSDHAHIKNMFPNAEFKKIAGAGHWIHTQKPYEFNKICVEFLNK